MWTSDGAGWLVPAFCALAVVSLVALRVTPPIAAWAAFILSLSGAVAVVGVRVCDASLSATRLVASISATLSLLWSVTAALVASTRTHDRSKFALRWEFVRIARIVALLLGVGSLVIQSVPLVMRVVYVGIALVFADPSYAEGAYDFGTDGLWSLGILFLSGVVGMVSARDRRLFTCTLWIAVMFTLWACLLLPTFRPTMTTGLERSGSTVAIVAGLAVLITLAAMISGWIEGRGRRRPALWKADDQLSPTHGWPGLRQSCAVIAVAMILLVCFHVAVPVAFGRGGFFIPALVVTGSATAGAWAAFVILSRTWSRSLADAAMGLMSMAFCALTVSLVPSRPTVLAERYPMIFAAMIIGFALATALWTSLSLVWEQQLDGDGPWTTAGRLVPRAKRFAFLNAAMALVVGALMAAWPRLRGISTPDDAFGQVTAGLAANLFLLLVILWSSRRLRRLTIHILTVLSILSTAGFILVRMLPFSPRFG